MSNNPLRVLYLHGFASSPGSRKARFFADRLRQIGFSVKIPDLAGGDFSRLTLSSQLELGAHAAASDPIILIGSSMGGYLAALFAQHHAQVKRLVLLAPAFDFYRLWADTLGPDRLRQWEQSRWLDVFHHAEGRAVPLNYALMEDACHYDPFPGFSQPALLFHGTQDSVVPSNTSVTYSEAHQNVRLLLLNSGHELTDVLELIWASTEAFLLGPSVEIQ